MSKKFNILSKMKGKFILLTLIFIIILFIFLIRKSNKYEVASPFFDRVVQGVYATGYVETNEYADITPNIAGRVHRILVKEGEGVKKGQILIELEDNVERETLEELKASLEYLKNEEERQKDLYKKGYLSKSEYEQAVTDYSVGKTKLRGQERLLDRMRIYSPIDGTVLAIEAEVGEMLEKSSGSSEGSVAITVGNLSDMIIKVDIDEEDIPLIKIGQKALITLDAFPNQIIDGIVKKISLKGNTTDKSFSVDIDVNEDLNLMVGMTTDVNVIIEKKEKAMLIPIKSLTTGNKVYIQENSGKIIAKEVVVGLKDENNVEILEGLNDNDKVLLTPSAYLRTLKKKNKR
jgi:membrane fusion protein (multidrug efflux system)